MLCYVIIDSPKPYYTQISISTSSSHTHQRRLLRQCSGCRFSQGVTFLFPFIVVNISICAPLNQNTHKPTQLNSTIARCFFFPSDCDCMILILSSGVHFHPCHTARNESDRLIAPTAKCASQCGFDAVLRLTL